MIIVDKNALFPFSVETLMVELAVIVLTLMAFPIMVEN